MFIDSLHRRRIDLRPGQAYPLFLGVSAVIHVQSGALELREALVCVGDHMTMPTRVLGTGESHVIAQGGWVQLRTVANAPQTCALVENAVGSRGN